MSARELPEDPPAATLSHVLLDAAADLQARIELGEYDDLDEPQMSDLRGLAQALASWGARAGLLEQQAGVTINPTATDAGHGSERAAYRN